MFAMVGGRQGLAFPSFMTTTIPRNTHSKDVVEQRWSVDIGLVICQLQAEKKVRPHTSQEQVSQDVRGVSSCACGPMDRPVYHKIEACETQEETQEWKRLQNVHGNASFFVLPCEECWCVGTKTWQYSRNKVWRHVSEHHCVGTKRKVLQTAAIKDRRITFFFPLKVTKTLSMNTKAEDAVVMRDSMVGSRNIIPWTHFGNTAEANTSLLLWPSASHCSTKWKTALLCLMCNIIYYINYMFDV